MDTIGNEIFVEKPGIQNLFLDLGEKRLQEFGHVNRKYEKKIRRKALE
jgi:hypothetical protein